MTGFFSSHRTEKNCTDAFRTFNLGIIIYAKLRRGLQKIFQYSFEVDF